MSNNVDTTVAGSNPALSAIFFLNSHRSHQSSQRQIPQLRSLCFLLFKSPVEVTSVAFPSLQKRNFPTPLHPIPPPFRTTGIP
jgi:hypothetical protein